MLKQGILGSLTIACALLGCSKPEQIVDAVVSAADEPVVVRYNEFVWCSNGPNYTPEGRAANLAFWVDAEQNTLQQKGLAAMSLLPRGVAGGGIDRMHLLMWKDKATRDAGWAAYTEAGIQEAMEAANPGVEHCGGENWEDVYPWNVYQPRMPSVALNPAESQPVVGYRFCSLNEGKVRDDFRAVIRGEFIPYLDANEAANGPSAFNFLVQVPDPAVPSPAGRGGIPEKFDYMWTNIWASSAEYETVMATWSQEGQAVQAAFDAVVTCSAELTFDLTPLMSASE